MTVPEPQVARIEADPKRPWKAVAAFLLTLLGTLWAALEGRDSLDNMSLMEWLSIVIPTVLTTGAVYGLRNPLVAQQVANPDDAGETNPATVAVVVLAALLVVVLLIWTGVIR